MELALFFIRKNISLGFFFFFFHNSCQRQSLCPAYHSLAPHAHRGFLSCSKQPFRTGSYRPRWSDRRLHRPGAGKPAGLGEIGCQMGPHVILAPAEGPRLGATVMESAGREQKTAGTFPETSPGGGRCSSWWRREGWRRPLLGTDEGNPTSTYFEPYLPQTSPHPRHQ